jgi:hypothetical protein
LDDTENHLLALKVLGEISGTKRPAMVWMAENLKASVKKITSDLLAKPRGKQVSELDAIAGDAYE